MKKGKRYGWIKKEREERGGIQREKKTGGERSGKESDRVCW